MRGHLQQRVAPQDYGVTRQALPARLVVERMNTNPLHLLLLLLASLAGETHLAMAQRFDEFGDIKLISRLPLTSREVETAFTRSRSEACEILPKGESLELLSFTTVLTERDRRESQKKRLLPTSRRDLFSVGLEFEPSDREALPLVSRSTIDNYLRDHYVSIQARVRRDLLDGKPYFHHRPLAVTAEYRGSKRTQDFEPLVANSIRNIHSLGLFSSDPTVRRKPEDLRTLVLVFRTDLMRPGSNLSRESFELVLIRGVEKTGELDRHVFVTTENRTKLSYLNNHRRPSAPSKCSILGQITVTDYDSTGIYPKQSATRNYRLDARSEYSTRQLDAYCRERRLEGGFVSNVTIVLDAIIDGQLPSEGG
jgi:hypothetical protein